jgi:WD40 repeat protein
MLEGHSSSVGVVAFSMDSKLVVSASEDTAVRFWDATTRASLQTLEGHSSFRDKVAFLLGGKLAASTSDNYTVSLWDVAMGASLQTLKGHSSSILAVTLSAKASWSHRHPLTRRSGSKTWTRRHRCRLSRVIRARPWQ